MELNELIQEIDIVDYISQFVELEEKNGEFWGLSCFSDEKTPSFSVRREAKTWFDFSSGLGGNVFTFTKLYYNCPPVDAINKLNEYVGDDGFTPLVSRHLSTTKVFKKYSKKTITQKAASTVVLQDNYMERYENNPEKLSLWRNEGITDDAMSFFGVKYDSFSNCIVYPIHDASGRLVNVGGRTLDSDFKSKGIRKYTYFKPWGGQMSLIYGLFENMEDILQKKEVILFEGMKSVLLARGYGFKNTGAILTSHLNPGQMKILARLGVRVVFALDKDVDVLNDHNINKLKHYVNCEYIKDNNGFLDDKDSPVDKGADVFQKLYESRHKYY